MLRIRPEQLSALNDSARRERVRDLLPKLRERHRRELASLADNAAIELVLRIRDTAARYEITRKNDVDSFLAFTFRFGEALDGEPWVGAILRDPLLDGPARMRRLLQEAQLRAEPDSR